MKKIKKVLAVLVTLAMLMAMSLTAFAATTGNITVNGLNANEETTVKIYQVVSHDEANSTWSVAEWAAELVDLEQNPVNIKWSELKDIVTAEGSTVTETQSKTASIGGTTVEFTDLQIGAYLIVATGTAGEYNAMGAALYTYDEETGLLIAPVENPVVWAKYSDYDVTKELNEASVGTDEFVGRGEEVVFDITATFPSFALTEENRTFSVTDTPVGLEITDVVVKVGGVEVEADNYSLEKANGEGTALPISEALTVDFTSDYIGTTNEHAGKSVVITVTAVVTSDEGYVNTANASNAKHDSEPVNGYTGDITITKKDIDATTVLTGAEFKVYPAAKTTVDAGKATKEDAADDVAALYFVQIEPGVYKLAASNEIGATQTIVVAEEDNEVGTVLKGTVKVKGLDEGTYWFEETKAPAGYSINADGVEVEIEANEENIDDVSVSGEVLDTKLSALPSTGGMGTTLFTIGGCIIMILAAALFFVNRRRSAE